MLVIIFTATPFSNCHGSVPAVTTAVPSSCVMATLCAEMEAQGEEGMDVRVVSEVTLPTFGQILHGDVIQDGGLERMKCVFSSKQKASQ